MIVDRVWRGRAGVGKGQTVAFLAANTPELLDRLGFCTGGVFTPRSRALADRVAGRLFDKPLSRTQVMAAVEQLRPK